MLEGRTRIRRCIGAIFLVAAGATLAQPAPPAATRTLEVAQILPRNGPLASVGNEIWAITQAAFDEFNSRPGAEARLKLLSVDDGNVGARSGQLAAGMPKDVVAYLSCFGTVGCLAQQKVASARRTPLVGPIAGAAPLRGPESGMSFAVRASAADELRTLLAYAQTSGLKEMAVLVQDDGFGRAYAGELERLIGAYAGLSLSPHYFKPDAPGFDALAARMQQGTPKALLLLANAAHSTAFLEAWRKSAPFPFVFNLAGQANALFAGRLKGYVGAAAFVTVTPSPWAQRTALQRDYQRVAAAAGVPLSYLGLEAYINARLLQDSLQRSGARSGPELARYLEGLQSRDLGGGLTIDYAHQRRGGHFTDMALLRQDGSYVH